MKNIPTVDIKNCVCSEEISSVRVAGYLMLVEHLGQIVSVNEVGMDLRPEM